MISEIMGSLSIGMAFVVTMVCLTMVKKYSRLPYLRNAFIFLSLSFVCYGIAESIWYYLDYHGIEPYQNTPDLFYIGYYVFGIMHVVTTLQYFRSNKKAFESWNIVILFMCLFSAITTYSIFSDDPIWFDYMYGLGFVVMAGVMAAFALICIFRLFSTLLHKSWALIGISIFLASVVDIQYYTLENLFGYEYGDFPIIGVTWFVTDIIMVIGVLIHRRSI